MQKPLIAFLAAFLAACQTTLPAAPLPPMPSSVSAIDAPLDFGVVYGIPGDGATDEVIVHDLQRVKDHGFDHVNLSSWIWTLPTAGTPLRHRVDVILDWCDSHHLGVWLLQNIQYGTPEGGDFERTVTDPVDYVRPYVVDWIAALKGHSCVRGVILGNEVGPGVPADLNKTPHYRQAFVEWLRAQYPTVAALNAHWDTHYETFDQVSAPVEGTPGRVDYQRFAQAQFGSFYSRIFNELFKPTLGVALGYASKTSADPFLYRQYPAATVLCWDDLVANYPLWSVKALTDCDRRPAFNSEMHLYHDNYEYYPSVELTRYRYYLDVLTNERANSSFDWASWKKPKIAAIDDATPAALAEVHRLEPLLTALAAAQRQARIAVVVSEPVFQVSSANFAERPVLPVSTPGHDIAATQTPAPTVHPLEDAYAALACTGKPWRFVLDADLPAESKQLDVVLVPGYERYPSATIAAITALPKCIQVEWAGPWPRSDEYGHPLATALLLRLKSRCHQSNDIDQAAKRYHDQNPLPAVRGVVDVAYDWWSSSRGGYEFSVRYPGMEVRRARTRAGREIVALINNTRVPIAVPSDAFAVSAGRLRVFDAATGSVVNTAKSIELKPFDIRILVIGRS